MLVDQRNPPSGDKGQYPSGAQPVLQGISPLKSAKTPLDLVHRNPGGGQRGSVQGNMYHSTGRRSWLR